MLADLLARRSVPDASVTPDQRAQLVEWRRRRLVHLLHGPGPDYWRATARGIIELSDIPGSLPTPRPPERWDF